MSIYRTHQTLIQRIRNKEDDHSWEEFVLFYKNFIFSMIRSMNISYHETEDLSQQVLLKVLDGIHLFDHEPGKHRFRSWLATITRNTVINYIKKQKRHVETMLNSERAELNDYLSNITVPDVETLADQEWKRYLFNCALDLVKKRLNENMIKAFELFLKGFNSHQVAEKMNLVQNTVLVYKKKVQDEITKEVIRLDKEHSE